MFSLLAIDGLWCTKNMNDEQASEGRKRCCVSISTFAAISFVSAVYIHFQVPETKGKSPEDFVDEEAKLSS